MRSTISSISPQVSSSARSTAPAAQGYPAVGRDEFRVSDQNDVTFIANAGRHQMNLVAKWRFQFGGNTDHDLHLFGQELKCLIDDMRDLRQFTPARQFWRNFAHYGGRQTDCVPRWISAVHL